MYLNKTIKTKIINFFGSLHFNCCFVNFSKYTTFPPKKYSIKFNYFLGLIYILHASWSKTLINSCTVRLFLYESKASMGFWVPAHFTLHFDSLKDSRILYNPIRKVQYVFKYNIVIKWCILGHVFELVVFCGCLLTLSCS